MAKLVDRARVADKEMRWWNVNEARAFLDFLAGDRLEALWVTLLTTGLRRGEALGLKWDYVDMDAGRLAGRRTLVSVGYQVRWSEPKGAASRRVVALDPATVAARSKRTGPASSKNVSRSAPGISTRGSCSAT